MRTCRLPYNLQVIEDGAHALRFFEHLAMQAHRTPPDILLLDLNLPRVRGRAVVQQIVAYPETYRYMKPQLSGHNLHAMGLTRGPLFCKPLDRFLEVCLNGEVANAMEERALVQRLMGSLRVS